MRKKPGQMGQQHSDMDAAAWMLTCADVLAPADETVNLASHVHNGAILLLTVHDSCRFVHDYDPVRVLCADQGCLKPADSDSV